VAAYNKYRPLVFVAKEICNIINKKIPPVLFAMPWRSPVSAAKFVIQRLGGLLALMDKAGRVIPGGKRRGESNWLHGKSILFDVYNQELVGKKAVSSFRIMRQIQPVRVEAHSDFKRKLFIGVQAVPGYGNKDRGYSVAFKFVPGGTNMKIIGIDPSLRATGIAVVVRDSKDLESPGLAVPFVIELSPPKSMKDPLDLMKWQAAKVKTYLADADLVLMEGLSFGIKNSASLFQLAGLHYFLRLVIRTVTLADPVIVAPTQLKKFVCGKGNVKKDLMLLNVYKRWGFEAKTDNEADALGLAYIGATMLDIPLKNLTNASREVVKNLMAEWVPK
jgi:crossover junction endodeoxyribonuclease RuvC